MHEYSCHLLCIFALDFVQFVQYNMDNGKGGGIMPLRYKIDVLNALKEKGYNTNKIRTEGLLSQSTLQKFRNQQGVSWENLETLCRLLDCQPADIIEFVREADVSERG